MEPESSPSAASHSYDVVIIGGAVAGASTAILLKRKMPGLKVLVVEKTDRFDWKVGESTVEISAYFLTRVLKQYDHLSREQLPKQAFRYWFVNDRVSCLREASEVGPTQLARTPSFQLDRSKLDEHLLKVAAEEGSEVWRPARVTAFELDNLVVAYDQGNLRFDGQVEIEGRPPRPSARAATADPLSSPRSAARRSPCSSPAATRAAATARG